MIGGIAAVMRRRLFALAVLAALRLPFATAAFADDTGKFLYQPGRVPIGSVFHYVKSNLDGSEPEQVVLYSRCPMVPIGRASSSGSCATAT